MTNVVSRALIVVEDRHAERALRSALESVGTTNAATTVLTGDALLAMRLRREGVDARLTVDGLTRETTIERDRVALDGVAMACGSADHDDAAALGTRVGACLEYTLIPAFIRAVRNITSLGDVLGRPAGQQDSPCTRIVLVGGGPLVDAARVVAAHRALPIEIAGGGVFERAAQASARLRAGRATKWVNTDFRALVLEPGFIWLLLLTGVWRRITAPPPGPKPHALIVVGDRFTADVVERLRGGPRPLVVAGATQPGRALFDNTPDLLPIEAFTDRFDPLRWIGWVIDASAQAIALANDHRHGRRFTVDGVACWPLVRRSVWLHVLAWIPALRQVMALAARAMRTYPDARVLTSIDVTAYTRVLVDTARRCGIQSMSIQHGIMGQPNGHSIAHVDRVAIWGDASKRWYDSLAPQHAQFVVTGNPRFDALAVRPPQPTRTTSFTIAVCTGFVTDFSVVATEYENLLMLDAVMAWARRHPGTTVIHKMHPGEETGYYASAARALGWDPLTLNTITEPILYDVLERSDVLVAAYSTTVLESIALGTPAIILDAIVSFRLLPLDEIGGIGIALSVEELEAQLDARLAAHGVKTTALRSDPALVDYIGPLDGLAAERIAALLRDEG